MLCIFSRINSRNCSRGINLYRKNNQITQNSSKVVVASRKELSSIRFFSLSHESKMSNTSEPPHHVNRLIDEKSSYLLQHAHNPVNWYPWCDEAIELAQRENKLIFLSIGYSTCHWCHIMEKESFENEEIAKIMNEKFVNIKVDREERPEIDKLYMTFILLINGQGGWPMSVFLTPDLSPITGGTYFPPTDRWGMPGFKTILKKVAAKWESSPSDLLETGQSVIEAIRKSTAQRRAEGDQNDTSEMTIEDKFNQAVNIYKRAYDRVYGGTNGAPKFPEVSKLNFLFHAFVQTRNAELLEIALTTLDKIADGGIHDHINGGFSRYSVDAKWHVPHFEKMLYDQAQLIMAYSNAFKITRNKKYLDIANKTFKYICKDLKHPAGGFFSGEDADSYPTFSSKGKVEGAFYAWSYDEVKRLFDEKKAKFETFKGLNSFDVYCHHFDIKKQGNVEPASDPHNHLTRQNILIVRGSLATTAAKFSSSEEQILNLLDVGNKILNEAREKRPRPHLDRKILTAWNGLLLIGIAKIACIRDNPLRDEYLEVGKKLVQFIDTYLFDEENQKLLRTCYGESNESPPTASSKPIYGYLDDYAFLIKGLLYFYVATLDLSYLHFAKELQELQDKYFWDDTNGGYFYSEASQANVVVRMKEDHDGAEPAGNSVSVQNLILLGSYFEEQKFKEKATAISNYFSNISPLGYAMPEMMSCLMLNDSGLHMLVVVGPDNEKSRDLLNVASEYYVPGLISILLNVDKPDEVTRKSVSQFKSVRDQPTAYVCHKNQCALPITDIKLLHEEFAAKYLHKED